MIYEKPHFRGYPATFLLVGFASRVEEWAYLKGYKCQSVHSSSIKKVVTGNGAATKEEMISSVKKIFKISVDIGSDEADALGVLYYAQQKVL